MKLKSYESPTLYLLELYTDDVILVNSGETPSEPEKTEEVYGPVDGGVL